MKQIYGVVCGKYKKIPKIKTPLKYLIFYKNH